MSAFEDAVIQRIKQLEREVERLQRWERPIVITDHGALAGLGDDDHPQYQRDLEKRVSIELAHVYGSDASSYLDFHTINDQKDYDARILASGGSGSVGEAQLNYYASAHVFDGTIKDGNGVEYSKSTHNHTGTYLPINGKAADSDKLDGKDSTDFGRPVFLAAPKTSTSWDGDARSTTSATKIDTSDVFGIPDGVKALIVKGLARDSASFPNTSTYFQIGPASSANNQIRLYPVGGDIMATVTGICNCDANGDIYYSLASSGTGTMDCWIEIWGYWL